jgi:hypothetical protein
MTRDNHYEAAFEAFLRDRGVGYLAVDEAKRTTLGPVDVKNADFIVVGPDDARLVVDVKGRKFPGGTAEEPRKVWQNWSTRDDIDGLLRWAAYLGPGYRGVLAFVYRIVPPFEMAEDTPDRFLFRDAVYLVRAVAAVDYLVHMKNRSPKWGTVHLPTAKYRELVKPFSTFLRTTHEPAEVRRHG